MNLGYTAVGCSVHSEKGKITNINSIKTNRYYYCLWNATMGVLEACYLLVNRMLVTRF